MEITYVAYDRVSPSQKYEMKMKKPEERLRYWVGKHIRKCDGTGFSFPGA